MVDVPSARGATRPSSTPKAWAPADWRARVCPRCEGPLIDHAVDGVAIHRCDACRGFFLDSVAMSEVEQGRPPFEPEPVGPFKAPYDAGQVKYLRCPLCRDMMKRENFGRRSGVIVDVCPKDGTWFDADELARVVAFVERSGPIQRERVSPDEAARRAELKRQSAARIAEALGNGTVGIERAEVDVTDVAFFAVRTLIGWL